MRSQSGHEWRSCRCQASRNSSPQRPCNCFNDVDSCHTRDEESYGRPSVPLAKPAILINRFRRNDGLSVCGCLLVGGLAIGGFLAGRLWLRPVESPIVILRSSIWAGQNFVCSMCLNELLVGLRGMVSVGVIHENHFSECRDNLLLSCGALYAERLVAVPHVLIIAPKRRPCSPFAASKATSHGNFGSTVIPQIRNRETAQRNWAVRVGYWVSSLAIPEGSAVTRYA